MKKALLSFLFLIIFSQLNGQVVFSKVYDIGDRANNAIHVIPLDGHLISVGLAHDMVTGLGVLKTDLLGNEIWQFTIDSIGVLKSDVITHDENYAYVFINDLRGDDPEEKILRIPADGDYDSLDPYQFFDLFLENPTIWELSKIPTGFIAKVTESLEITNGHRESVIVYDENFVAQSWLIYRTPTQDFYSRRLVYDPTGGYAVTCYLTNLAGEEIQAVKKIDNIGNTVWTYELPYSNRFYIKSPVVINQAGEILVTYIEEVYDPVLEVRQRSTVVVKLDAEGNVLWETKLSGFNLINFKNAFLTTNEDLILLGRGFNQINDEVQGKVTRINQAGEFLWERIYDETRYGGSQFSDLNNGFEMDNGDLLFAGTTFDTLNNLLYAEQDFWLLRVGPDGCYLPDCEYANQITPVKELPQLVRQDYLLIPTVTTDYLSIRLKDSGSVADPIDISVVNVNGQEMYKKSNWTLPHQLDTTAYLPGFYFVMLTNNRTGQIETLKFIKQ